jgi:hypothetical protein
MFWHNGKKSGMLEGNGDAEPMSCLSVPAVANHPDRGARAFADPSQLFAVCALFNKDNKLF